MFVLGVTAPILIFVGAAFKVNHWPGAGAYEWARYCFVGSYLHSVNMLSIYESVIRMVEYKLMRDRSAPGCVSGRGLCGSMIK